MSLLENKIPNFLFRKITHNDHQVGLLIYSSIKSNTEDLKSHQLNPNMRRNGVLVVLSAIGLIKQLIQRLIGIKSIQRSKK